VTDTDELDSLDFVTDTLEEDSEDCELLVTETLTL